MSEVRRGVSWRATLLDAGAAESAGAGVVNFEVTYSIEFYSRVLLQLAGTVHF